MSLFRHFREIIIARVKYVSFMGMEIPHHPFSPVMSSVSVVTKALDRFITQQKPYVQAVTNKAQQHTVTLLVLAHQITVTIIEHPPVNQSIQTKRAHSITT